MRISKCFASAFLVCGALLLAGCGGSATVAEKEHSHDHDGHGHDHGAATKKHDHSGWWCNEHGVPESVCALCDTKLAVEFQKKGDWCKEHDRPDSQCFACHPEKETEFAALYEAKYGRKPPKPEAP